MATHSHDPARGAHAGPPASAAPLFVILEHTTADGRHWDFLMELPARPGLAAWRLAANPLTAGALPIPAEGMADHRRVYLEFEGELSGGRGRVRRIARGACAAAPTGPDAWRIELHSPELSGWCALDLTPAGWTWRMIAAAI